RSRVPLRRRRLRALASSTHPPAPAPYPLSLHDALPISNAASRPMIAFAPVLLGLFVSVSVAQDLCYDGSAVWLHVTTGLSGADEIGRAHGLNSSHVKISYAVFCLKKKTGSTTSHAPTPT